MKKQFLTTFSESFLMWIDHTVLSKGEAFTNNSGQLYNISDNKLSYLNTYSSPFNQWVYDSSINNAIIPSGVYINNAFVGRGTNELSIDFMRGRCVLSGVGNNLSVTSAYSIKDFNIYLTSKSEDELVFKTRYKLKNEILRSTTGTLDDKIFAPCIYIKNDQLNNTPLQFGGTNWSNLNIRTLLLCENQYELDNLASLLCDTYNHIIPYIDNSPLNYYGDFKNGTGFNFIHESEKSISSGLYGYITEARFSRFSFSSEISFDPNMYLGAINFSIKYPRISV